MQNFRNKPCACSSVSKLSKPTAHFHPNSFKIHPIHPRSIQFHSKFIQNPSKLRLDILIHPNFRKAWMLIRQATGLGRFAWIDPGAFFPVFFLAGNLAMEETPMKNQWTKFVNSVTSVVCCAFNRGQIPIKSYKYKYKWRKKDRAEVPVALARYWGISNRMKLHT